VALLASVLLVSATLSLVGPTAGAAVGATGFLRDSAGNAYSGWQVDVYGTNFNVVATATTDSSGAFSTSYSGSVGGVGFTGPPTAQGWRPVVASGRAFGAVTPPLDVTLPVVTASVTVTDAFGAPVVGAHVASTGVPANGGTVQMPPLLPGADSNLASQGPVSATTDATGTARLSLLKTSGATADLVVTPPAGSGLQPSTTLTGIGVASASSRTVVLDAVTTATVSGVARDGSGATLPL